MLHTGIKEHGTKPVVGFIAGETAPKGRTMGHAGAIVGGSDDTAQAKKQIMRECGIHVVESPAEIGKKVAEVLIKYMLLKNKNVIITGATRGIGKGIALEFAKQGANIIFTLVIFTEQKNLKMN